MNSKFWLVLGVFATVASTLSILFLLIANFSKLDVRTVQAAPAAIKSSHLGTIAYSNPGSPASILTVCKAGFPTCDYGFIQAAVDAASDGDIIRVASGTYTDVHSRLGVTQTVYLTKSLTIQGGYTTDFMDPPDPESNPTILNPQDQGRVFYITGLITPTLAGLQLRNGYSPDSGAGIFNINASLTLNDCQVHHNQASSAGGGVYMYASAAPNLNRNSIYENEALGGVGGGVYLYDSPASTLSNNLVYSNTTNSSGGGIYAGNSDDVLILSNAVYSNTAFNGGGLLISAGSDLTITQNQIFGNDATANGGGIYLVNSNGLHLKGNKFWDNRANSGGGIYASYGANPTTVRIDSNQVEENSAGLGAGIYLFGEADTKIQLENNWVVENLATSGGDGSGIYIKGFSPSLLQTTVARNTGGNGSGISLTSGGVSMTNTILVSQTIGINVPGDSTAVMAATLWGSGSWANGSDWTGAGTLITGTTNLWADPFFINPALGDFHILATSPAVDSGIDSGVTHDIDGEPRPYNNLFDLGSDEYHPRTLLLPLILRNYP